MDVYYNGVTLKHATVTSWDETVEYDSSGMNLIGNKITLSIEGTVFPLAIPVKTAVNQLEQAAYRGVDAEAPNAHITGFDSIVALAADRHPTDTFAFRLNSCLRQLSMPRGSFKMQNSITGEVLFVAFAQDSSEERLTNDPVKRRNCDVDGGPKPHSVRIVQTTNEFARISFSITIMKIRCLAGEIQESGEELGSDPLVGFTVSNRCWTEETIDSNFYVTRTFTGKLRISSVERSVHFWRNMYYPPLEDGFKRESVRFSESENGLELSYVVTDKQTRISPPYPATAFSGTLSYSVENSCMLTLNVNLTMIGRPDADKKLLRARAFQAVTKKTDQFTNAGKTGFQTKLNVSENFGDPPSVTVSCAYTLFSAESEEITDDVNALATILQPKMEIVGTPLEWEDVEYNGVFHEYNRFKSPKPNPWGYNVFSAYDDETNKTTEGATTTPPTEGTEGSEEGSGETSESGDESDKSAAYGFIKCMATVPCLMRAPSYLHNPAKPSEMEDLSTKVYKDEDNVEYPVASSGARQKALDYPYSFYKSDITYFTDYSRVVLPKARYAPTMDDSDASGEDYSTYSIARLNEEIKTREDALEDLKEGPDLEGLDETEAATATEAHNLNVANIKKELAALKRELDSRTHVRVVQVARPVPKARVIIEAERYGRLPEMPDPDEIVTTTGDNPIVFTPLKVETRLCEPKAAKNTPESVSYSIIGTYEYAMSRAYKKGDEVWLLMNPTFGSACYYPKVPSENGMIDDMSALKCLYYGDQMTHVEDDDEQEEELSQQDGGDGQNPSPETPSGDGGGAAHPTPTPTPTPGA